MVLYHGIVDAVNILFLSTTNIQTLYRLSDRLKSSAVFARKQIRNTHTYARPVVRRIVCIELAFLLFSLFRGISFFLRNRMPRADIIRVILICPFYHLNSDHFALRPCFVIGTPVTRTRARFSLVMPSRRESEKPPLFMVRPFQAAPRG